MVETMDSIVIQLIRIQMQKARYLAFSYDEVMMINNQSWCNSHVYVVDGFEKMPLLLNLERVVGKGTTNNLTTLILKSLMEYGDLIMDQIGNKFFFLVQMGLQCSHAYKLVLLLNLGLDLPFSSFQCTTWHIKLT